MKKSGLFLAFTALFSCALLLCFYAGRAFAGGELQVSTKEAPIIILDAGHGGEDGGAVGSNGILEKDLNLSLTRSLAAFFRLAGYTVVETRTEDKLLYGADAAKGHKKQSDLENRLAFTERYPDCILISVHMNTFPNADCKGLQVWYSQEHPDSIALADAVQNGVRKTLQPQNNRKIKAATSSIFLLRHASVPAILIECGFLSTAEECERLCDPAYQKALAMTIFFALDEKIGNGTCESP